MAHEIQFVRNGRIYNRRTERPAWWDGVELLHRLGLNDSEISHATRADVKTVRRVRHILGLATQPDATGGVSHDRRPLVQPGNLAPAIRATPDGGHPRNITWGYSGSGAIAHSVRSMAWWRRRRAHGPRELAPGERLRDGDTVPFPGYPRWAVSVTQVLPARAIVQPPPPEPRLVRPYTEQRRRGARKVPRPGNQP